MPFTVTSRNVTVYEATARDDENLASISLDANRNLTITLDDGRTWTFPLNMLVRLAGIVGPILNYLQNNYPQLLV